MEYYKEGIDLLNELKEEAQNIEDDTVASNVVYYFLTTVGVMVIVAGVAIIGAMAGSPAISAVPAGMLGYKLLNMHNKHITGLKSAVKDALTEKYHKDNKKRGKEAGYTRAEFIRYCDDFIKQSEVYYNEMKQRVK